MNRAPKVAAICMQKDEGSLIRAWIIHHANLFGPENLYILDNVSSDPVTLAILDWAERCGVNVMRGLAQFERKGVEVTALIDSLRARYDWFFPLDADEFVGIYRNGQISMQKSVISSEMLMLRSDKIVRMSQYVWSIPGSPLGYYAEAKKVIVPTAIQVALDKGFHLFRYIPGNSGNTVPDEMFQSSNICYIHLHNKPFELLLRAARLKMSMRVKSFDREDLIAYSGDGGHLIKYFLMNEDEYQKSFPPGKHNLETCFFDAGLALPFSEAAA